MRTLIVIAGLAVLAPWRVPAQSPPFAQGLRAAAALELMARDARPPLVSVPHPSFSAAAVVRSSRHQRATGETLMIIGGAAVVIGAIAGGGGGDVLIVGGVVCAGYGFYLYAQ